MANLIEQGRQYIHRQKISSIKVIDVKKKRSEIIKQLLPKYDIQDKPRKYHDSTAPDKLLIGGYGSGKTYTGSAEDIFLAYINRPLPVLVIIQTKSNSEVTTEDDLKQICNANNLEYWLEDDRGGTYRYFYIKFGDKPEDVGKLMLASGSVPNNLKGPTVAAAHIDEPFVQPKETMEVVISRARDPKAVINEVHFTGTIEPGMQWGHEYVDNDFKGTKDFFKIQINTEENKFAPKDFINRMKRLYTDQQIEMYIKGNNVNINGKAAYERFTKDNIKPFTSFRFKPGVRNLLIGMDFNVSKMCAAEFYLDGKIRRQIDEYINLNSNTKQLCEKIVNRLQDKYEGITGKNRFDYHILIVPDAAARQRRAEAEKVDNTNARQIYQAFSKAGFNFTLHVPKVNPFVYARVQVINELFAEGRIIIYDNCTEAINDRKFTNWKEQTGEGWVLDKKNGRSHMSEAADYPIYVTTKFIEAAEEDNASHFESESRPSRF